MTWRSRRCQTGLGIGSQEVATQVRQQLVPGGAWGYRCGATSRWPRGLGQLTASEHWQKCFLPHGVLEGSEKAP